MPQNVLITGVAGFTGRYVADLMRQVGYAVSGLVHQNAAAGTTQEGTGVLYPCDLSDASGLIRVLEKAKPDYVVHLAGVAFAAHNDIEAFYKTNVVGTRNLLDALVQTKMPVQSVIVASSANIYGQTEKASLDEETPPAPTNDYGISKLASEHVARLYSDRLPIIVTRPFNYTGVGQAEQFLIPKIVSHVRRRVPVIELGNLDVARDFSDVRDIALAYQLLLECPQAIGQTVNLCSGRAYSLRDVLTLSAEISGFSIEVRVNPAFVRHGEAKLLVGSRTRCESLIGSLPLHPLADTLRWMLEA